MGVISLTVCLYTSHISIITNYVSLWVELTFKDDIMSMAVFDFPPTSCQFSVIARPVSLRRFFTRYLIN